MKKRSIRSLQKSPWQLALRDGVHLAQVLNGERFEFAEDRERAASFISQLHSLTKNPKGLNEQREEDFAGVNEVLRNYPWVREVIAIGADGPVFGDFPAPGSSTSGALQMREIINLAGQRLLGRLRQCHRCARWFFAIRNTNNDSCGEKCRQAKYRSTPEYKALARKYRNKRYHDFESLEAAKRLRRRKHAKK